MKILEMPTEKELLERIRDLEFMNSVLRDKLDSVYEIVAPDYESADEALIQIEETDPLAD